MRISSARLRDGRESSGGASAGRRRRRAQRGLTIAATALATLLPAAPAMADSASVSFTDALGQSDPVVGVGRTFTLTGNSAASKQVFIRYRAVGGAPCAPSASSDSGGTSFGTFTGDTFYGSTVNGNFTLRKTGTWSDPGTFTFCIWLASSESTPVTPFLQNVTFRSPTGTISATVSPVSPLAGQTATVTITGSSEAPESVYATIRGAGGAPCATSYSADSGQGLISGRSVNGAFSVQTTTTQSTPGTYLICMWLASSSSDGAPVAGPQPATFTVLAPPRPCVVPPIARFTALANYLASLSAANCTVGKQRYTPSVTFPRGTIIKATPVPGTSLAPMAPVELLISNGKRCRVPSAPAATRLSAARSRLRSAGCVPGRVRTVSSHRRRGTLVGFTPRSGTTLSPRAVVGIRVSRGRHR